MSQSDSIGGSGPGELSGAVLGRCTDDTWYDVQIAYQLLDPQSVSMSYWIDGSFAGSFRTGAVAQEARFAYLGLTSGAGSAYFDNVSITANPTVPEPASLALVAASLLGLLASRRRPAAKRPG